MNKLILVAVIALMGLVLAGAASATTFQVTGTSECDTKTGEYVIVWTISSQYEGSGESRLGSFELPATQTERVSGDTTSVSLDVHVVFSNEVEKDETGTVELAGDCEAPPPPPPSTTGGTTGSSTTGGSTGPSGGGATSASTGELPHTGLPIWIPLLAAGVLVGSGLVLARRRDGSR